jgi:DNA-3-methyladenine glycosylase II
MKMIIKYPQLYQKDIIFSRLEFDPLFLIQGNKISFLLYIEKYIKVDVVFEEEYCEVFSKVNSVEIIDEVKRIFDLDSDFKEIDQVLKNYRYYESIRRHVGKPLCLDTGLYESLIRGIIHQQVSMKGAYTLTNRLIEKYGISIDGVKGLPRASEIAELTISDLRELKYNTSKAEYLIRISKMIVDDELDLSYLVKLDLTNVYKEMLPIKGIGKWTIHCFLLFGKGDKHLFLKQDLGVMNAIKIIEGRDERPSNKEMIELESEFSEYQSYITYYLWYCL